jgi:hypothetical protein
MAKENDLLSQPSLRSDSVSSNNNGLEGLHLLPPSRHGISLELNRFEGHLREMMMDEIKMGLAIFRKKARHPDDRQKCFKCCLEWSNAVFDQQFELKNDFIEDQLN